MWGKRSLEDTVWSEAHLPGRMSALEHEQLAREQEGALGTSPGVCHRRTDLRGDGRARGKGHRWVPASARSPASWFIQPPGIFIKMRFSR